jgi:hypothetical protein
VGVTCEDGGPAGVFFNSIDSDGSEFEGDSGKVMQTDPNNTDVWMFKERAVRGEWDTGEELGGDVGCYLKKKK